MVTLTDPPTPSPCIPDVIELRLAAAERQAALLAERLQLAEEQNLALAERLASLARKVEDLDADAYLRSEFLELACRASFAEGRASVLGSGTTRFRQGRPRHLRMVSGGGAR